MEAAAKKLLIKLESLARPDSGLSNGFSGSGVLAAAWEDSSGYSQPPRFKKLFLNGPNPASFCLFSFFSQDKYSTNFDYKRKKCSWDSNLGQQDVGEDESTELWQHPHVQYSFFLDVKNFDEYMKCGHLGAILLMYVTESIVSSSKIFLALTN